MSMAMIAYNTYVIIVHHHFGGGCGLITSNRALMNVQIDAQYLETTQQIDDRYRQYTGQNHGEGNGESPIRIRGGHNLCLYVFFTKTEQTIFSVILCGRRQNPFTKKNSPLLHSKHCTLDC